MNVDWDDVQPQIQFIERGDEREAVRTAGHGDS